MQWKMERLFIGWGFVAAAVILVCAGWGSYRNTTRFAVAAGLQKHTYEVLRTLDETGARLVDAETGQRGSSPRREMTPTSIPTVLQSKISTR